MISSYLRYQQFMAMYYTPFKRAPVHPVSASSGKPRKWASLVLPEKRDSHPVAQWELGESDIDIFRLTEQNRFT